VRRTGRIGRPPGSDGDETRQRILEAARSCFAAFGYAATTNRMIADRAGLTSSAVYHHFGQKHELMLAVHHATEERYLSRLRAAVHEADGFDASLRAIFDVIHETVREDPEQVAFSMVAREEARRHEELAEIARDRSTTDLFHELVQRGVSEGAIAPGDAVEAQGAIAALATGLAISGGDLGEASHRVLTEGCKRLAAGTLLGAPTTT
jgi:AcrR family transcriptional regulator